MFAFEEQKKLQHAPPSTDNKSLSFSNHVKYKVADSPAANTSSGTCIKIIATEAIQR